MSGMRVLILTLGTRGDLGIFLALARELRRRGHRVTVGTSAFYAESVAAAGAEHAALGGGTFEELREVLRSMASVSDLTERTRLFFTRWLRPQLAAAKGRLQDLAWDTDYFVSNLKLAIQRNGRTVPGAFVTYDPPASVQDLAAYGAERHAGRVIELVAMSRALIDPEQQWPEHFAFTGFWYDGGAAPTADLERFVAGGPPPVAVTLGSMISFDVASLVRKVTEAVRSIGRRAVIVGGWSGVRAADSVEGVTFCTPEAPYDWLFPRSACVLHHGGCGTAAAVLRAGVPSVVMPQVLCQQHLAEALARQGLSAATLDTRSLHVDDLARAIATAASDDQLIANARRFGDTIRRDPGVAGAAGQIEEHAKRCENDS
jgi:UDP:flavonoid glycosyltransferase YjiC (YdhE family)